MGQYSLKIIMKNIIKMYGTSTCDDCRRSKEVFAKYNVPYEFFDINTDDEALDTLLKLSNGEHRTPVILLSDERVLVEPSNKELITALNL